MKIKWRTEPMGVTVNLDENRSIRVTEDAVETQPPDTITFVATGTVAMTEALLVTFEGTTLNPTRVSISVDDSRTVDVDLSNGASLRLDTVDVGVETPDSDDLAPDADSIASAADDGPDLADSTPGAIAFTVEGVIRSVSEETLASISSGFPALEALTFAVEDSVVSDGGSDDDVIFEFTVLGFGITVRRSGTIDVGMRENPVGLGPS